MHLDVLLADLAIVFAAGVLAVLALGRVGLPPVVGFLLAGVLVGPHALGWVADVHLIEILAELGVALLLFTIGLEFSFDRLRRMGRLVALGGSLQVGLTVAAVCAGAMGLGLSAGAGVFWGYLVAMSSTAIILRVLAQRGEVDAPHGRVVVGVLLFQDLAVVPMMLSLPLLSGTGGGALEAAEVLAVAAAVVLLVVVGARLVVPWLFARAAQARSREVFVLTALLVAAGVAWTTASLGLSIALGAFLAGIVIAETEFAHQVVAEVSPLRDAFASLFFVSVGMLLDPAVLLGRPLAVAGLAALLVFGKLALGALAVMLLRLPARVALLAALALAQVGEFSFVLLRAGEGAGLLDAEQSATFLAAAVLTMVAAPLLLLASPRLARASIMLGPVERLLRARDEPDPARAPPLQDHVVVAGLGLGGRTLLHALASAGVPAVGLDLNPDTVATERRRGLRVHYGDAASPEVLEHVAQVGRARQVVLLLSDVDAARRAAVYLRAQHPGLALLLRVHRLERDLGLPGVQILAEDAETAVEIVERVLRVTGVGGALLASAVAAARAERGVDGGPVASPAGLAGELSTLALTLADHRAVGHSLAEVGLRTRTGALVVALSRGGVVGAAPGPGEKLRAGDTLFLVGRPEQLAEASRHLAVGLEEAAVLPVAAPPEPVASVGSPRAWVAAGVAPVFVTGLLAFLHATLDVRALVLYAAAVALPAWLGGPIPAAIAGVLSFVLANVTFVAPVGELTLEWRLWPLVALLGAAALLPILLRQARPRATS